MKKPKTVIVDKEDNIIGLKERGTLMSSDIYRVAGLWIQNSKGEVLLAQRSLSKKQHPGGWGPAVAGTIEEGETYDSNIEKEAEEELGLKNHKFEKAFYYFSDGRYKHFTQAYFAIVDKEIDEFTIQKEEVEKIKWFTKEELLKELDKNPGNFLKSVSMCLDFFTK